MPATVSRFSPRGIAGWVMLILAFIIAVTRAGYINEGDVWWQIRAGKENLSGLPLIRPDSWSFAPVDGNWVQNSPGWNTFLAWISAGGNWPQLLLLGMALTLALYFLGWKVAKALGSTPVSRVVSLTIGSACFIPALSLRSAFPATFLFLCLVTLLPRGLALLERLASGGRFYLTLLSSSAFMLGVGYVGVWLHLSWIGLAFILGVIWGLLLITSNLTKARKLLSLTPVVLLLLGVLLGPYGLEVWNISLNVGYVARGLITEWMPAWTSFHGVCWWLLSAAILALVGYKLWRRSWQTWPEGEPLNWTGVQARLLLVWFLSGLAFTIMGLFAYRFVPWACFSSMTLGAALTTRWSGGLVLG